MGGIFISYRRNDSAGYAGRLLDHLHEEFGEDIVFQDVESVRPGDEWPLSIKRQLEDASVVLVIIGSRWSVSKEARRRGAAELPEDWVRFEIATALELEKVIIPVLVGGARIPSDTDLPDELKRLTRIQFFALSQDRDFDSEFEQLVKVIRRQAPAGLNKAVSRRFALDGDLDHRAHAVEMARGSTPRHWALERVRDWIDARRNRFLLVTGFPGTGKSTLAAQLVQLGTEPPTDDGVEAGFLSAFHFCSDRDSTSLNPVAFCQTLAAQLARSVRGYAAAVVGDPKAVETANDAFLKLVVRPLSALASETLILIDAVDEAAGFPGFPTILDLVARTTLPDPVRFILTLRSGTELAMLQDQLRPGHFDVISLSSREAQEEVRAFVVQALQQQPELATALSSRRDHGSIAEELFEHASGNFLVLRHVLDTLSRHPGDTSADLEGLPAGLDETYRWFLQSLEIRHRGEGLQRWREILSRVLGLLAAAREPLRWEQLAALSGLSSSDLRDMIDDLRQFLDVRGAPGREVFAFYHRSFGEFLLTQSAAGRFWCDAAENHARFRDFYLADGTPWETRDEYALRNLVAHCLASAPRRLPPPLEEPEFWQARLDRTGTPGLLADLELAEAALGEVVGPLRRAILRESPAIQSGLSFKDLLQRLELGLGRESDSRWRSVIGRQMQRWQEPRVRACWVAPTPGERSLICNLTHGSSEVTALALSEGSAHLFVGFRDGRLESWDLQRHSPLFSSRPGTSAIRRLLPVPASPGGQAAAFVAFGSGEIARVDAANGQVDFMLAGESSSLGALALSRDGATLFAGDAKGRITFWDLASRGMKSQFNSGSEAIVDSVDRGDDGVVTLSANGKLTVWSLESEEFLHVVRIRLEEKESRLSSFSALVVRGDGTAYCAAGCDLLHIRLRDGKLLSTFGRHPAAVSALAAGPSFGTLVSASSDGHLRLWDVETETLLHVLARHASSVSSLQIHPALNVMVSGDEDGRVRLWDLARAESSSAGDSHQAPIRHLAFAGGKLVSVDRSDSVRVWTSEGQVEHRRILQGGALRNAVALSSAAWLLGHRSGQPPLLWDLETCRQINADIVSDGPIEMAVSSRGDELQRPASTDLSRESPLMAADARGETAITCADSEQEPVVCWQVMSGRTTTRIRQSGRRVSALAMSDCGRFTAVATRDLEGFDLRYATSDFSDVISPAVARTPAVEVRLFRSPFSEAATLWTLPWQHRVTALAMEKEAVLAGLADGTVLWLGSSGGEATAIQQASSAAVTTLAFLPATPEAVGGHEDGTLSWFTLIPSKSLRTWKTGAGIRSLTATIGRKVAVGLATGEIIVVELVP